MTAKKSNSTKIAYHLIPVQINFAISIFYHLAVKEKEIIEKLVSGMEIGESYH